MTDSDKAPGKAEGWLSGASHATAVVMNYRPNAPRTVTATIYRGSEPDTVLTTLEYGGGSQGGVVSDKIEKLDARLQLVEQAVVRIETDLKHKPTTARMLITAGSTLLLGLGGVWAVVQFVGPSIMAAAVHSAVQQVLANTPP